jgi:cyclase
MSGSRHDHPELGPAQLVEVADRVFAYIQPDGSWYINNTGFVAGRSSVISIDACSTERRTRAYLGQIAAVTPAPVTTLVNTHHHGDHTNGNSLFGGATIVGHESTRTAMIAAGPPGNSGFFDPVDWGEVTLAPPTLTFADRVKLWSDDLPLEVSYVGQPAHTTNDSLVWLPEQQVLFCGDLLFNGGTPFVLMGSVRGAIDVLTTVVAPIPAATIVPGHGAPCDRDLIGTVVGYLEFVLATAAQGRAAGLSPLEAAREADLGGYAGWLDAERIVGNLHRAYADLDPARPAVSHADALRDMVAYNGGAPLSCYA